MPFRERAVRRRRHGPTRPLDGIGDARARRPRRSPAATSRANCPVASSNASRSPVLATGNPVLLADEPTGELDFTTGSSDPRAPARAGAWWHDRPGRHPQPRDRTRGRPGHRAQQWAGRARRTARRRANSRSRPFVGEFRAVTARLVAALVVARSQATLGAGRGDRGDHRPWLGHLLGLREHRHVAATFRTTRATSADMYDLHVALGRRQLRRREPARRHDSVHPRREGSSAGSSRGSSPRPRSMRRSRARRSWFPGGRWRRRHEWRPRDRSDQGRTWAHAAGW